MNEGPVSSLHPHRFIAFGGACLLASTLVACSTLWGFEDPASNVEVDGGGADDAGSPDLGPRPMSCAEALSKRQLVQDGPITIDPDGAGPVRPFEVFCRGVGTDSGPLEYLSLPRSFETGNAAVNVSIATGGAACKCGDMTTSFSKVRLRVSDLTVLVHDGAFAKISGDTACSEACWGNVGPLWPHAFGMATACTYTGPPGRASIDLQGTPFAISDKAVFVMVGWTPSGNIEYANERQTAVVTGNGYCGGFGPTDPPGEIPLAQR